MVELRELALISAKECEDIAKAYDPDDYGGETRLMRIALSKEIHTVMQIALLLDKPLLSEMSNMLKGVLSVGGVLTMSCNYYCVLVYTCMSCFIVLCNLHVCTLSVLVVVMCDLGNMCMHFKGLANVPNLR